MPAALPMPAVEVPPLRDGDVLTRGEFLRRWERMPELRRAERLEGMVRFMPSPVSLDGHAIPDNLLGWTFTNYAIATPGTASVGKATTMLDFDNDFQPDQALIVLPEFGGRTRREGKFLAGPPELVAEVAHSTAQRDRGAKKNVYRRNGVQEYLVWRTADAVCDCWILDDGQYRAAEPVAGVWRSAAFPGLRIDLAALLRGDAAALRVAAEEGLRTPEHAAFVAELAGRAPRP